MLYNNTLALIYVIYYDLFTTSVVTSHRKVDDEYLWWTIKSTKGLLRNEQRSVEVSAHVNACSVFIVRDYTLYTRCIYTYCTSEEGDHGPLLPTHLAPFDLLHLHTGRLLGCHVEYGISLTSDLGLSPPVSCFDCCFRPPPLTLVLWINLTNRSGTAVKISYLCRPCCMHALKVFGMAFALPP